MLEGDSEKDIKIKEILKSMPQYDNVFKRWESASKMRQWVNEKKNNLSEKVKKDVEAEYKKKKEEEKVKAAAEQPAKVEEKPPAAVVVVEEEKKQSEESSGDVIKTEEIIILIDTVSKETAAAEAAVETKDAVDGQGFNEADKAAIEELIDKKFNEEL